MRNRHRAGITTAFAALALVGFVPPGLAQGSQNAASTSPGAQAQPGNVNPGGPLTPGLAVGSTTGGASGGTVNRQPTAPNGRANMLSPASRSFSIRNYTGQPIVSATATMTNGAQHRLNPTGPIAAAGASEIVVPLQQCLAGVTVQLKNGQRFRTGNLHDCQVTQIVVNGNGIQIGSTQTAGAQNGTPTK